FRSRTGRAARLVLRICQSPRSMETRIARKYARPFSTDRGLARNGPVAGTASARRQAARLDVGGNSTRCDFSSRGIPTNFRETHRGAIHAGTREGGIGNDRVAALGG